MYDMKLFPERLIYKNIYTKFYGQFLEINGTPESHYDRWFTSLKVSAVLQ